MGTKDSAAVADPAQGTPDEPDAPAAGDSETAPTFGDLVTDEAGRHGLFLADGVVLWLGEPARCDLPLRKA